jgi:hypothetical protein
MKLPAARPLQLLDPPNLALDNYALYPVSFTSDAVLKLAAHRWQQLHDDVRPSR